MRVKNLIIPIKDMEKILMGNLQVVWLLYPKGTKIHHISYDRKNNDYVICIHHESFDEITIVEYNYNVIPNEPAPLQSVPGLPVQINLFLQLQFPKLLQDYASIQGQIKDRCAEEQTQLMQGIYRMRIGEYIKIMMEMEMNEKCKE